MHSHLDIQVNGKSLVIPDDSSLSVEEKNPMFNDVTFFSYPMQIPVEGNREVLKNIAHRDSDMRAMDLEHADARIFADGLPLNHGQVITQDGSEIKDTFEFNIDAQQQSFSELIGNLECQDVDITDKKILIGEKIGDIEYNLSYDAKDYYFFKNGGGGIISQGICGKKYQRGSDEDTEDSDEIRVEHQKYKTVNNFRGKMDAPQALGFSFPGRTEGFPSATKVKNVSTDNPNRDEIGFYTPKVTESFINVTQPYPFPYCNSRVAYAHPDKKKIDEDSNKEIKEGEEEYETSGVVMGNNKGLQPQDYGQYWCLDANRQQSGICFYVLYFLDCLFEQLDVVFNKDELLAIEDFTRLCFFTTKCEYDSVETNKTLNSLTEINDWLRSRNCGGQFSFAFVTGEAKSYDSQGLFIAPTFNKLDKEYLTDANGVVSVDDVYYNIVHRMDSGGNIINQMEYHRMLSGQITCSSKINEMYANSKNFPNASVSSVISSLENSFGIRFLYDPETRIVTAKLLRNLYSEVTTKKFMGRVLSMTPVNEKITGVRVAYSAESDKKEQRMNVRNGVRDYDTDYDYIDFPEDRTITDMTYSQIVKEVRANNMNVYIDKTTGNAYRIKINADAEDSLTLKPTLFQVAQNKGVEEGDCSEQNKNYVREMISDFSPVPMNVINAKDYQDGEQDVAPLLAPFLEVEMEHEYLEKRIHSVAYSDNLGRPEECQSVSDLRSSRAFPNGLQVLGVMRLWLSENYDPTQTDSGNSPLQDIDWGLTLGVMRGAGTGASHGMIDTGITTISVSQKEFRAILTDFFGRSTFIDDDARQYRTLEYFKNYLDTAVDNGTYTNDTIIDTKSRLTIGTIRNAINLALTNAVEPWTDSLTSMNDVLYPIVIGIGFDIYYVNSQRVFYENLVTQIGVFLRPYSDDIIRSDKGYIYPEYMKQTLDKLIGDGKISGTDMIYSRCNLTVNSLRNYMDLVTIYYGTDHKWFSATHTWHSRWKSYLRDQGQTGKAGQTSSDYSDPTGSQIIEYDHNYDGFDNSKWRQTVGIYALTSDLMDLKGAVFDYNGSDEGDGGGERFSLQIRAYQQPSWALSPLCANDEYDSYNNIVRRIRSRGLYDVFLREFVYFLLHRKIYKVNVLASIAQLLDIRNHWTDRYIIDGKGGWINSIKYKISKVTGVSKAEIEFYSL